MIYKAPFRKFLSQKLIRTFCEYDMYISIITKEGELMYDW